MKLPRRSFSLLSVIGAAAALAIACGESNATDDGTPPPGPDAGTNVPDGAGADGAVDPPCTDADLELQGEAYANRTLKRGCIYKLTGNYSIYGAGVDLTIEPGVTIEAQGGFVLRAGDGARMLANGTAERPITMRSSDATRAGGWQGLHLAGAAAGVKHELRHVIVRDGASAGDPGDDTAPAVYVSGAPGTSEVLFDHFTVEDSKHGGIRLFREPTKLAAGSTDIVVKNVPGYPIVLDAIHVSQLPARQMFQSTNPARARIMVFGGNEGDLFGDHTWLPQNVPFELGVSLRLGVAGKPSSLTIAPPATLLMRDVATLGTTFGKFIVKSTGTDKITFDWAEEGKYWGSISLTATKETSVAHQSVFEGVTFRHGGLGNNPIMHVLGPGGPGSIGDCSVGATITGCTFSDRAPSVDGADVYCLQAHDHSYPYEASNTFTNCGADVECD